MLIKAQKRALKILKKQNYEIINSPQNEKLITVVTPTFNAEKFISKTIDSVIQQSIGFENLQLILVDDCSIDNTRKIIREYTTKYNNISAVFLKKNSGTPAMPRNIGIELANSKYITFLDADDWLHPNGLEILYNILKETNDDFAVGRTVKVESGVTSFTGEFYTHTERKSISPFDEPMIFYHSAPPGRMMKLSIIKQNNIRFPEMKFAEDKTFFIEVLLYAQKISITNKPIYYINRTDENNSSLTKRTSAVEKRMADLKLIKHIKRKKLPIEKEKIILNRLYEYDCIRRTFDTKTFPKSKLKVQYFRILKKILKTTKNLRYDFREEIENPMYRTAIDLFLEGRTEDFVRLFKWSKSNNDKKVIIKDQLAYFELPFLNDHYKYIRIPLFAEAEQHYIENDVYYQNIHLYGDEIKIINSVKIRDRKNAFNEVSPEFKFSKNMLTFQVDLKSLDGLGKGRFVIFIQYNNHNYINIRSTIKNKINYNSKTYEFYSTVYNNLALAIK